MLIRIVFFIVLAEIAPDKQNSNNEEDIINLLIFAPYFLFFDKL